jgi:hypothetical protein
MRQFQIECTTPTLAVDVEAVLRAAMTEWVDTMPQTAHTDDRTHEVSVLDADYKQAQLDNKDVNQGKPLVGAHDRLKAAIKRHNAAGLDVVHATCVSLMTAGIEAAVVQAHAVSAIGIPNMVFPSGTPVRVSVSGYCRPGTVVPHLVTVSVSPAHLG